VEILVRISKNVSVNGVTFLREHVSLTGNFSLAETKLFQQRKLEQEREERIEVKRQRPLRESLNRLAQGP
jgi:hypothetical protein